MTGHPMTPDRLRVITCIWNPIGWQTRDQHYLDFRQHMLDAGVKLTVVECALGRSEFKFGNDPAITHVGVRSSTLAWNKENLINLGIQRGTDPEDQYIAWVDADVEFRNKNWASETVRALQQYDIVQPWSDALDLGPRGEVMTVKGVQVQTAFAKVWRETQEINASTTLHFPYSFSYPHPGYAWAARREVLNTCGGLIEASGLGAGDHQMAMAFIGQIINSVHGGTHVDYQAAIKAWADRAYGAVRGNVGYVAGTIEHKFHGEKDKRKYQERWQILIKHQFNPVTDIRKNLDGVIELAGNKPEMMRDFDSYFRSRDEDANIRLGD